MIFSLLIKFYFPTTLRMSVVCKIVYTISHWISIVEFLDLGYIMNYEKWNKINYELK